MALPTSSTWDLADFSGAAFGTLLYLGPSDLTALPSTAPYFSNDAGLKVLYARSSNGVEASLNFSTGLPSRFTLDLVLRCPALPHNLGDLEERRCGLTLADDAGRGFTLYFAKTGVAISRVDSLGSVTALPDTTDVTEAVASSFHTVRVAVDGSLGRAYIFVGAGATETPALRWIVPVEATPPSVADLFRLFVKGTAAEPVSLEITSLRLASDLVIANYPPVADAGPDRVTTLGNAVRLDGRGSYDVEGGQLSYRWRCTDAPMGSTFAAELGSVETGDDGDADGSTDTVHANPLELPEWVAPGDILRLNGAVYEIAAVNSGTGELTLTSDAVPDDLEGLPARLIRQSILLDATAESPTAVPDVAGIYRFRLVVSDGEIESEPSEVLANISALQAPLGVEPDVSILWKAIGDEWRFIEGREVFEEAWRGVAQILAGKLLEAWQLHYNSSIRDAQRVFQRKWIPYRTFAAETSPDTAEFVLRNGALQASHAFELSPAATAGQELRVVYWAGSAEHEAEVTLAGGDLHDIVAALNLELEGSGIEASACGVRVEDPDLLYIGTGSSTDDGDGDGFTDTVACTSGTLPGWLVTGDILCIAGAQRRVIAIDTVADTVEVTPAVPDDLSDEPLRFYRAVRLALHGDVPFRVEGEAAVTLGFPETLNRLRGEGGARVTDRVYYVEGVDLLAQGVQRDDLLVLNNGESFRIDRVLSDPSDPGPNQRVLLFDELPLDASPAWAIPSVVRSTEVDYEQAGAYPGDLVKAEIFEEATGAFSTTSNPVVAQKGSQLAVDLAEDTIRALLVPEDKELRLLGLKRRKAIPLPEDVVSIPTLQEIVPEALGPTRLREHVDYILAPFYRDLNGTPTPMLQFADHVYLDPDTEPPDILWAETTLYDNEKNVEALFGRLVNFYRDDAATFPPDFNYIAGVAGLLYAQQRGPSLFAVGVGAQILLGQPFAEVAGYVEEVNPEYSPKMGRIILRDDDGRTPTESETVRAYYYRKDPHDLSTTSGLAVNPQTGAPWVVGEHVPQFSPLGGGISVDDVYSDPKLWYPYIRSGLLNEVEKFHRFAVSFNIDLVSTASLGLLYSLIHRIKPTASRPFLTGERIQEEDLDLDDTLDFTVTLHALDTPRTYQAFHYDDYSGGGGTTSTFDDGVTRYDGLLDSIVDTISFELQFEWEGGPLVFDLPLFYDSEIVDVDGAQTGTPGETFVLTYDMELEAGTYGTEYVVKGQGVLEELDAEVS